MNTGKERIKGSQSLDSPSEQVSRIYSAGSAHSSDAFSPSSYDVDLTMDGTAQSVALASGIKLGYGRVSITNTGATTEAIRFAFGTSALNAEANLNIVAAAATTGVYIPSIVDGIGERLLRPPALATHYAVANAVAADVQVVIVTQGG